MAIHAQADWMNDPEMLQEYATESAIIQATELILQALSAENLTQKSLAVAAGKSPSELSRLLKGDHNITLKTLATYLCHAGRKLVLSTELLSPAGARHVAYTDSTSPWVVVGPESSDEVVDMSFPMVEHLAA